MEEQDIEVIELSDDLDDNELYRPEYYQTQIRRSDTEVEREIKRRIYRTRTPLLGPEMECDSPTESKPSTSFGPQPHAAASVSPQSLGATPVPSSHAPGTPLRLEDAISLTRTQLRHAPHILLEVSGEQRRKWTALFDIFLNHVATLSRMFENNDNVKNELQEDHKKFALELEYICRLVSEICDQEIKPDSEQLPWLSSELAPKWAKEFGLQARDIKKAIVSWRLSHGRDGTKLWEVRKQMGHVVGLIDWLLGAIEKNADYKFDITLSSYRKRASAVFSSSLSGLQEKVKEIQAALLKEMQGPDVSNAVKMLSKAFWCHDLCLNLLKALKARSDCSLTEDFGSYARFVEIGGQIGTEIFTAIEYLPSAALNSLFTEGYVDYAEPVRGMLSGLQGTIDDFCHKMASSIEPPSYIGITARLDPVFVSPNRSLFPYLCMWTKAWYNYSKAMRCSYMSLASLRSGYNHIAKLGSVPVKASEIKTLLSAATEVLTAYRFLTPGCTKSDWPSEIMGTQLDVLARSQSATSDDADRAVAFFMLDLENLSKDLAALILIHVWFYRENHMDDTDINAEILKLDLPIACPQLWNELVVALSHLCADKTKQCIILAMSKLDGSGELVARDLLPTVSLQGTLHGDSNVVPYFMRSDRCTVHSSQVTQEFLNAWLSRCRDFRVFFEKVYAVMWHADIKTVREVNFALSLLQKTAEMYEECASAMDVVPKKHVSDEFDASAPFGVLMQHTCDTDLALFCLALLERFRVDLMPVLCIIRSKLEWLLQQQAWLFRGKDLMLVRSLAERFGLPSNFTLPQPATPSTPDRPIWKSFTKIFAEFLAGRVKDMSTEDRGTIADTLALWLQETAAITDELESAKKNLARLENGQGGVVSGGEIFQLCFSLLHCMMEVRMILDGRKIAFSASGLEYGRFEKLRLLARALPHKDVIEFCSGEADELIDVAIDALSTFCNPKLMESLAEDATTPLKDRNTSLSGAINRLSACYTASIRVDNVESLERIKKLKRLFDCLSQFAVGKVSGNPVQVRPNLPMQLQPTGVPFLRPPVSAVPVHVHIQAPAFTAVSHLPPPPVFPLLVPSRPQPPAILPPPPGMLPPVRFQPPGSNVIEVVTPRLPFFEVGTNPPPARKDDYQKPLRKTSPKDRKSHRSGSSRRRRSRSRSRHRSRRHRSRSPRRRRSRRKSKKKRSRSRSKRRSPERIPTPSPYELYKNVRRSLTPDSDRDGEVDPASTCLYGEILKMRRDRNALRVNVLGEGALLDEVNTISQDLPGKTNLEIFLNFYEKESLAERTMTKNVAATNKLDSLSYELKQLRSKVTLPVVLEEYRVEKLDLSRKRAIYRDLVVAGTLNANHLKSDQLEVSRRLRKEIDIVRKRLREKSSLPKEQSQTKDLINRICKLADRSPDFGTKDSTLVAERLIQSLHSVGHTFTALKQDSEKMAKLLPKVQHSLMEKQLTIDELKRRLQ